MAAPEVVHGIRAIAAALDISTAEARRLIAAGRIRAFKLSGRLCARRPALDALKGALTDERPCE